MAKRARATTIEQLAKQPTMDAVDLQFWLKLSRPKTYDLLQSGTLPFRAQKIGSRYKISTAAFLGWFLDRDVSVHGMTTPPAATDSIDGISPVVTFRSGKVVDPDRVYRARDGRRWPGADIIAVAQMLGVA